MLYSPVLRRDDDTDTDSTDEETSLGHGCSSKFSHDSTALSHQHWVQQAVSAGTFSVHDTEGAEAHHKYCMHLASLRVRHLHECKTKQSMLEWLCWDLLFESLQGEPAVPVARNFQHGVRVLLGIQMEEHLLTVRHQQDILHPQVLLARVELLDLVCDKFNLPCSRVSYEKLAVLTWKFGQKLVRKVDAKVFWATDSGYTYSHRAGKRRDVFFIEGTEYVPARGADGSFYRRCNALCCESICFLTISGLRQLQFRTQLQLELDYDDDSITFVLARWFEPHPSVGELRDKLNRPICPGPLNINHCLWRYALAPSTRRVLLQNGNPTPAFASNKNMFGKTIQEQMSRLKLDSRAYFCLIQPSSIISTVNISPGFVGNTTTIDRTCWLQTVTVI